MGMVQVYGLPGLDLVQDLDLEDVLGFPWGPETDPHPGDQLQGVAAASQDGQVLPPSLFPSTSLHTISMLKR
jgi:hypothetical protein